MSARKPSAARIRDAAKWARADVDLYGDTADPLDALADAVERGEVDASDLEDRGWSAVVVWAESHGHTIINVSAGREAVKR